MRLIIASICGLLPLATLAQEANVSILTLVADDPGFNEIGIDLAVAIGDSSASSTLTGTLEVEFNIDTVNHQTNELTIFGGDLAGTDVTLEGGTLFANYSVTSSDLRAFAETLLPPGTVNPENGEFDASQHGVVVDQGTLEGEVKTLLDPENPIPIRYDYGDSPFEGRGSGTGTITLTPTTRTETVQHYDVTLIVPFLIVQNIQSEGVPIEANVTMSGNIKAIGTTFADLPLTYAAWAADNGIAEALPSAYSLSPILPNHLIFSLGYDADNVPSRIFAETEDETFTLQLTDTNLRKPLIVEFSEDLFEWFPVPEDQIEEGQTDLPIGYSGDIILSRFDTFGFYRVSEVEPSE